MATSDTAGAGGVAGDGPVVRVVGVPEHFNLPWRRVKHVAGVRCEFMHAGGGTGAMVKAVLTGEADVAVALTEGIVAAIVQNEATCPLRYVGEYVTAPLRWMIATGATAHHATLTHLAETVTADGRPFRVGISRLGSGSHLMAQVLAQQHGWPPAALQFVVLNDFRSMRRAVLDGTADLFLWEWFMTLPFVKSGELRALGAIPTPWNSFGFVARADWLEGDDHRRQFAVVATAALAAAAAFVQDVDASCEEISAEFGLALADAHDWMRGVSFAQPRPFALSGGDGSLLSPPFAVSPGMLQHCMAVLTDVGVFPHPPSTHPSALVDGHLCSLDAAWRLPSPTAVPPTAPPDHAPHARVLAGHNGDIFTPHTLCTPQDARLGAAHAVGTTASRALPSATPSSVAATAVAMVDSEVAKTWVLTPHEGLQPEAGAKEFHARRQARLTALAAVSSHLGSFGGAVVQPPHKPAPVVGVEGARLSMSHGGAVSLARVPSLSLVTTSAAVGARGLTTPGGSSARGGDDTATGAGRSGSGVGAGGGPSTPTSPHLRPTSSGLKPARAAFPDNTAMGVRWEGVLYDIG